jgi:hypothetical protein
MEFIDALMPLVVLSLAYVLLFAVGCSRESEEQHRRTQGRH